MNSNVFQIREDYLSIINEIEASGGEITEDLEEKLAINKEELDTKLEAYVHVIKQKQADINLIKDEVKRLYATSKVSNAVIDKLKSVIVDTLRVYELYGKTGNLAYRLPKYNIYTTERESVDVKEDKDITSEDLALFPDVFEIKFKSKFTKDQADSILEYVINTFAIEPEVEFSISKDKFKEELQEIGNIENPEEREIMETNIKQLGNINSKTTLNIR